MKYLNTYNIFNEDVTNTLKFNYLSNIFYIKPYKYNDKRFFLYNKKSDIKKDKYIGEIEFKKEELSETFSLNGKPFPKGEYWYLTNIWVNKEYIGKGLGKTFLNIIVNELNINDFYLQSTGTSYNRWIQLGKDTGYLYRNNPKTNLIYIKHL